MKLKTDPQFSPPPLPRFVQIEPVGQCNLRCRMCPIAFRRDGPPWGPPAFMAMATFKALVDQFPQMDELHLQGLGEPMMHPEFFAMVRYAAGKGAKVSTNTNLTLLTSRRARECVDSGLHALHASIDGATAETYEYIRRDANFRKVIANLDRLIAARAQAGSPTPQVRIVAVAMRRNLEELPAIVSLAREHGVDAVFVQHLCHDYGEGSLPGHYHAMRDFIAAESLENEDPGRLETIFAEARRRAKRLAVDLRLPPLTRPEPKPPHPLGCDWPHRGAYLSYRGEAMPCCMVSTPDRLNLGDMAKESVVKVWNGPAYREFRTALASGEPPEICRGCGIYNGTF
ncbi:MAG: radical protein [Rhodocyclaceae bacterium]|nr:radical protein [Rhodocyclaceae bacterium]